MQLAEAGYWDQLQCAWNKLTCRGHCVWHPWKPGFYAGSALIPGFLCRLSHEGAWGMATQLLRGKI